MSGVISDLIGRRKTMVLSIFPMIAGLVLMGLYPVWPVFPMAYGLVMFGWAFVMVLARASPADEIAAFDTTETVRRFTMVFMPAFAVDGACPLIGAALLDSGLAPTDLYLIAALAGVVTMVSALALLRETLSDEVRERARQGPTVNLRGLGRGFWWFALGMLPFYFAFNMALPYFGNLCVGEWGVSPTVYAITWSAFSFTFALASYSASGLADRAHATGLIVALAMNALIILLFGVGSGVLMMFLLEVIWAAPIAVWIGTENTFAVRGVDDDKQGRALGTYDVLMRSTGLLAANVGAWVWTVSSSLRVLYVIAGVCGLLSLLLIRYSLGRIEAI